MTTELLLGPLDLMGLAPSGGARFKLEALSTDAGTSWGNADTVDVQMRSFLQHGSLVETEGWENRTIIIAVSVTGAINDDNGAAEAALLTQLHRQNTLTYKPETATVRTVFPVLTATLVPVDDDYLEAFEAEIVYQIRLTCRPFARGENLITVDAVPVDPGAMPEVVEDITAGSTGWSAYGTSGTVTGPTVDTDGVTVEVATLPAPGGHTVQLDVQKTYPETDTTVNRFIGVDWAFNVAASDIVLTIADAHGVTILNAVASDASPDNPGLTRTYFDVGTMGIDSFTTLRFAVASYPTSTSPVTLTVKMFVVTGALPSVTAKQQLRRFGIEGSMPTTGSIKVAHDDEALGDVVVYTCRGNVGGYTPALRGSEFAPGTPDATAVSGARDTLDSAGKGYEVANENLPDGDYLVLARVKVNFGAGGTDPVLRGVALGGIGSGFPADYDRFLDPGLNLEDLATFYPDDEWCLIPVAEMHLPVLSSPAALGTTTAFEFSDPGDTGKIKLDDIFLLNLTIGQITQVACGTDAPTPGGTASKLWIDSPDTGNGGQPQIWRGTQDDRSDAYGAWVFAEAIDIHEFDPQQDGVTVFTITTNPTSAPAVSFTYYDAYWYRAFPVPE